jgi:hypothetical protein
MSLDTDKNGSISYLGLLFIQELISAFLPREIYTKEDKLLEAFIIID